MDLLLCTLVYPSNISYLCILEVEEWNFLTRTKYHMNLRSAFFLSFFFWGGGGGGGLFSCVNVLGHLTYAYIFILLVFLYPCCQA